jgi:uncharacterized protein
MIRLHRIALSWPDGYRLEIECQKTKAGPPLEHSLPINGYESANLEDPSSTAIFTPLSYEDDPEGLYESIRLQENTDYFLSISLPGTISEISQRWEQSKSPATGWPFVNPRLSRSLKLGRSRYWQQEILRGAPVVTIGASINFASFVGVVDLSFDENHRFAAEVATSKLDYFKDFKSLLGDISEDIVELILEVDNVAGLRFEAAEPREVAPSVLLFHLRRLMAPDALPLAVETIIRNPQTQLVESTKLIHPSHAANIDPAEVVNLAPVLPYNEWGPAADLFLGWSPLLLPEKEKTDILDTPENRYVKNFLTDLSNTCHWLKDVLIKAGKVSSGREVHYWEEMVDDWLGWQSWKEVGPLSHIPSNSQVLLRRSGYREILEASISLQYGLSLPWERGLEIAGALGDIRPIYELYEYWCFFALRKVLRNICGHEADKPGSFYESSKKSLHINLRKGRASRLRFTYSAGSNKARVSLFYNRLFNRNQFLKGKDGSYSTAFRPDFSILVAVGRQKHWLHFDAKYSLNLEEWKRQIGSSRAPAAGEERDADNAAVGGSEVFAADEVEQVEDLELYNKRDLYKMHTYRDAILKTRGTYILFPSTITDSIVYVRHPDTAYREKFTIPSIGAFPLTPQFKDDQMASLVSFLNRVFSEFTQSTSQYAEEDGLHRA